jgi:hypothetical protein
MSFVWFLAAVLVAVLLYIRISRRISNLNLELSDNLKSEIISLITEFNRSAEQNIDLIENKTNLAKSIAAEIEEKLGYMHKLKKTLEKEIREAELKLRNILVNEKSAVTQPVSIPQKSVIAKAYESIKSGTEPVRKEKETTKEEKIPEKEMTEKTEESRERKEGVAAKQEQTAAEKIEQKEERQEKKLSLRQRVIRLQAEGISPADIAAETGTTLGEVELILKFSRQMEKNTKLI